MALKIACGQIEIIAGRPDLNTKKILHHMDMACQNGIDILLLPELAVPGYFLGDLWEQTAFIEDCAAYGDEIIAATENCGELCVIFGNIAVDNSKRNEDGRARKYNAAFAAQHGKLLTNGTLPYDFIVKNALPNYREFDDNRHFYGLRQLALELDKQVSGLHQPLTVTAHGETVKLGLMLCEDGWTENYFLDVPQLLSQHGAELLCNISCSPFSINKNSKRHRLFGSAAQKAGIPLIYCNNVGIQNNGKNIFTFDGCSCVYGSDGWLLTDAPMYAEATLCAGWDSKAKAIDTSGITSDPRSEIDEVYHSLRYGCQRFLEQAGIGKMTIGLSGGIDSAVTAALFVDILGPDNVLLVNMPSRYNSPMTQTIAEQTAQSLGANYTVIPITESCLHTSEQLTQTPIHSYHQHRDFQLTISPLIYENIQSRDRGSRVVAGLAAAFGGAFSCNSNKTELTVGYATFYGDICGALAPIGDLWKHHVYELGRYLNDKVFQRQVLPEAIFTIRPSAELSSEQTVGTGGDPLVYPYHDKLFRSFLEQWRKTSPAEILLWYSEGTLAEHLGCEADIISEAFPDARSFIADLEHWWKLMHTLAVAKRIQAPPIVSITRRAYGYDHREAQLTPYFPREYHRLKAQLLND